MNNIFGYELQQDYKPGPYYQNERAVKVSPQAMIGVKRSGPGINSCIL